MLDLSAKHKIIFMILVYQHLENVNMQLNSLICLIIPFLLTIALTDLRTNNDLSNDYRNNNSSFKK